MTKSRPLAWTKRVTAAFGSGAWGLGAALIASLCCAPPAVAFVLGLGGSAFLVGLAQYKPFFALAGLAVMVPIGWRLIKPVGRCGVRERRARIARLTLLLAAFVGGYLAINYLLLPWLYAHG
jgi:hypothetical protein